MQKSIKIMFVIFISCFVVPAFASCINTSDVNTTETKPTETTTNTDNKNNVIVENDFDFQIKGTYNSRKAVLNEIDKLRDAYYNFEAGKSYEEVESAKKLYNQYLAELNALLFVYPPSEQEILEEKEKMLNSRVELCKQDYFYYKNGIDDSKLNESEKKQKQKYFDEYQFVSSIQNEYIAGKITIDEALETLEIKPSSTLKIYYDQIESAKSNNN